MGDQFSLPLAVIFHCNLPPPSRDGEAAEGRDRALLLSVSPESRAGPGTERTVANTYWLNEWREEWLVRGMNGRTDESASDKHEVTRIKH